MLSFLQNELIDKSISELYLKSDLADVKFAFKHDGSTVLVPAHKLILASGSPVFRTMFFGSLPENDIVEIVDASAEEFEEFLQLFYARKLKLTMENMDGVIRLADKYDMLDCLNTGAAFLGSQLTDENMLWAYQLAILLNNQQLKELCESKIAFLSDDMFKTEAFLNCDRKILKGILLMETLNCNEHDIFEACAAWAKVACRKNQLNENDSTNLKNQLGDCIYLIQFGKLTSDELGLILNSNLYADMFDRDERLELTSISLVPNFKLKIFKNSSRKSLGPSFLINKNTEMDLQRISHYLPEYRYLSTTETTWFTSNTLLLMGKITFSFTVDYDFVDLDFNIINHHSNKTLHNGKIYPTSLEVCLDNGILIKPHELYGIHVNFRPNLRFYSYYTWDNSANIQLTTNIAVKLQNNPNGTQNDTGGVVLAISFKRV